MPALTIIPFGTPRRSSSAAINPALDTLNESLTADVPVELSAVPVTLTAKRYFFATRASSSRLSNWAASVRAAVLRRKKKYTGEPIHWLPPDARAAYLPDMNTVSVSERLPFPPLFSLTPDMPFRLAAVRVSARASPYESSPSRSDFPSQYLFLNLARSEFNPL